MNSLHAGDSERIVTIMSIMANEIYCADESGKTMCVDQSLVHASGVLAPALGQRLIVAFASAHSADVVSVRLPS
jgi:hypothetical protein